ncbi:MAG: sigma-54 dependent transcriptional regulator [Natronospirillum sp.]
MSLTYTAAIIDDDPAVRESLDQWLTLAGINVLTFSSADSALTTLTQDFGGAIVSDIRMPGMDGMDLLRHIDSTIPVILITGHGGIAQAVEAMKLGAYDFVEKPYKPDHIVELVKRACEQRHVSQATHLATPEQNTDGSSATRIAGQSAEISTVRQRIVALARVNADVIVLGETGTGKELVARSLHELSIRADHPFVAINVAAVPENLLESELFGHDAGAFTGAVKTRQGIFEAAHNGTLFLDEIESMSMEFQIKLLRVLQEREVTRVGSRKTIPVNVRVISATKVDLREAATQGYFREDLYYRLMVAEIHLPALRERRGDIPMLFSLFLRKASQTNQLPIPELSFDDVVALELHDWPGNVRELENTAERYLLSNSFNAVSIAELLQLESAHYRELTGSGPLTTRLEQIEKSLIAAELNHYQGNIKNVMEVLSLPRRTLNQKMQKYGLRREDFVLPTP